MSIIKVTMHHRNSNLHSRGCDINCFILDVSCFQHLENRLLAILNLSTKFGYRCLSINPRPDLLISGVSGHKYPDTHNVAPGPWTAAKCPVFCRNSWVHLTNGDLERDWDLGHDSRPLTEKNTTVEESRIKTEEFLNVTNFHYK